MTDWWIDYPWRLIQTNLREIDMAGIRASRLVADLQGFQATVLMINAAGIIASYPTQLSYHFQSPFLTGDSLQDILQACHAARIRVIARTDFSKVRRPIYETHPDWAYLSPLGKVVDYNGDIHVCLNSPYQQEHMLSILEELLCTHDFDGVFFNMSGYQTHDYSGNYYGICHCANCQHRFQDMFTLDLPEIEDPSDPVYRKYTEFKRLTLHEHQEKVYGFLAGRWPHLCIANHLKARRGFIRQESNIALDRPLPHWQYSASENTRWAVGSYPEMISSNTTVDFIDFPYRHAAVSPHQQSLRLAQNLANGGALDYYLIGRLDNHEDRSGFEAVKTIFGYHAAHEAEYQGLRSKAGLALLKPGEGSQAEYQGWFRVLVENHFLFDVITSDAASTRPWDQYSAFILPGPGGLTPELARKLDRFVEGGGAFIASSLGENAGDLTRSQPPSILECLGIEKVLKVRKDMRSSYFKMIDKTSFPRFPETDLIFIDGPYIYARYTADTQPAMHLIPPHPFGPPERCYYDQETEHPGYTCRFFGRGRAISIPWSPGALYYRQGYTNTANFMADLLQGIAGLQPVGGNLPPMVEVTRFEQSARRSELIQLVNASGHFGNSFYGPLPLQNLEIILPSLQPPVSLESLSTVSHVDHSWQDGLLTVRLPELGLFAAIKIQYP